MVIRAAIVGLSEGNGHPFSFSSIVNGYSDPDLAVCGWPGIYEYVRRRDASELGLDGMRITHAWTQDPEQTGRLCSACRIPSAAARLEDLLGAVDAVIIARDDHENHHRMAMPFLEAGMHVFLDKPLALDIGQLRDFKPYLESGKLMSCSGMHYAKELDDPRAALSRYGTLKLVRGAILNSWEHYGVHILDAMLGVLPSTPVSATALEAAHTSVAITMSDGSLFQVDALGAVPRTFKIEIFGTDHVSTHEITDNFSMFRRTLWHFRDSIVNQKPAIPPSHTIDVMRTLIAGILSGKQKRKVHLDEIHI